MALLAWPPVWAEGAALYAGAALSWALALYVTTRGGLRRIPLLAALAMGALVVYLLGQGVGVLAPDHATWAAWFRRTWWGVALAPALWLLVTLALVADEGPEALLPRLRRLFWGVAIVSLSAAAA